MTFAGLPPAMQFSGMLFTTTEPAPITEFLPIVTPLSIIERAPIKTFSSITTGEFAVFSFRLFILSCQLIGCESVSVIRQPLPISTLSPILILLVAFMVAPEMPTFSPMIISAPVVAILNTHGCMRPPHGPPDVSPQATAKTAAIPCCCGYWQQAWVCSPVLPWAIWCPLPRHGGLSG